jgi:hypothetical protein
MDVKKVAVEMVDIMKKMGMVKEEVEVVDTIIVEDAPQIEQKGKETDEQVSKD